MDVREKLVELIGSTEYGNGSLVGNNFQKGFIEKIASNLIAHGVTVQECCHKADSVISKTGLMCTACYSDIDRDSVFCKYCGAKVMPHPPKGE